jgi:SAM-dependent methyltransferase
VVGLDAAAAVIAEAQPSANLDFRVGDVYALDFPDASFDVVHAHQVLQHLSDPVAALREMRRVLRPSGVLAVRDSDYGSFTWAPADPRLDRWLALYHQITARNEACADAGRYLLGWVQAAGFGQVQATSSTWTFADPESRQWWGGLWADRMVMSSIADQAVTYRLASSSDLADMAEAWRHWAAQPDGYFAVVHGEIIARPLGATARPQ